MAAVFLLQKGFDLVYAVEYSTDLDGWLPTALEASAPLGSGDGTETVQFTTGLTTAAQPRQFMRVRVSKQ